MNTPNAFAAIDVSSPAGKGPACTIINVRRWRLGFRSWVRNEGSQHFGTTSSKGAVAAKRRHSKGLKLISKMLALANIVGGRSMSIGRDIHSSKINSNRAINIKFLEAHRHLAQPKGDSTTKIW